MNSYIVILPISMQADANLAFQDLGYGPNTMSVLLCTPPGTAVTHCATHWWADDATALATRNLNSPPGGWSKPLTQPRINALKSNAIWDQKLVEDVTSGAAHFAAFIAANGLAFPPPPAGGIADR